MKAHILKLKNICKNNEETILNLSMYLVYLISDENYRRIEFYLYQLHVSQKLQILSERKKLLKI